MELNRRGFLVGGALAGLGLAAGVQGKPAAAREKKGAEAARAELKLSSQEGIIPGSNLKEKLASMEKWGIVGLEPHGRGLPERVAQYKAELQGTPIKISAICAGFKGALASDDEAQRKLAVDTIKEILTAAGELGATGMIIVPAFNGQTKLGNREARKILMDQLPALGDHAVQAGTRLLLEPLNRNEAFFLRQLADAAAICRELNHPGIALMGDFYHMCTEEPSDMGAFLSAGKYLHHIHLASRTRKLPGQDERDFTNGFKGLQMIGYRDYCSFECGVNGDRLVEIPKCVKFLQDQWKQAWKMPVL